MNALKAKTTIHCNICGCKLKRTKTIKVESLIKEDAIKEAKDKIESWKESLKDQTCKVCKTIINSI